MFRSKQASVASLQLPALLLCAIVAGAAAQTFSFGTTLGGGRDAIPTFDSQRSSSSPSDARINPFSSFSTNSRSRSPSVLSFEDFFSSSRIGTPKQSSTSRGSSRSAPVESSRKSSSRSPSPNPTITSRGSPLSNIRQSTSSPARPFIPSFQTTTPVPVTRETAPVTRAPAPVTRPATSVTRPAAPVTRPTTPARRQPMPAKHFEAADAVPTVRATPDLSSRGRTQEEPIRQPTTPETNEVNDVRDNLVGQSICARGKNGDACRKHLATTAMACTSGFCQQCQQCGTMSPDQWPKCCREHFLCCRPLAKACQACDTPILAPFCGAAFGRCN